MGRDQISFKRKAKHAITAPRPLLLRVRFVVVHFLRRYESSLHSQGEVSSGLSPYNLRRTTAYIKEHLAQELNQNSIFTLEQFFRHATDSVRMWIREWRL